MNVNRKRGVRKKDEVEGGRRDGGTDERIEGGKGREGGREGS